VLRLRDNALLLAPSRLGADGGRRVLVLGFFIAVTPVLRGGDPEARLTVLEFPILVGEIHTLTILASGAAALRQSAGADGELAADGGVLRDPVCQGILAVLDDPRRVVRDE
jgi:hypothetical protein